MTGITSLGIGSGIDMNNMIEELVANEGEVEAKNLASRETTALNQISAFGILKNALNEFKDSVEILKDVNKFQVKKTTITNTTVSTDSYFKANAGASSVNGSFYIEVNQLARSHKLISKAFSSDTTQIATGQFLLKVGDPSKPNNYQSFTIDITDDDNSLLGIKDKINAQSQNSGVVATIVKADDGHRLVLTSSEPGLENSIDLSVLSDSVGDLTDNTGLSQFINNNMESSTDALDAIVVIDGNKVTRSSNTISGAIDGVTLELEKADVGNKHELKIDIDSSKIEENVELFVEKYNAVFDVINNLTGFTDDITVLSTDAEAKNLADSSLSDEEKNKLANGVLKNDQSLRSLEFKIRNILNESIGGTSAYKTLSQIGIVSDPKTSKLKIELDLSTGTSKVQTAITNDISAVSKLFAGSTGVMTKLYDYTKTVTNMGDGLIDSRRGALNKELDEVDENRVKLEERLKAFELQLKQRFTFMDQLVGKLRNVSDFLTRQLSPENQVKSPKQS